MHHAYRLPTWFTVLDAILSGNMQRVVEYELSDGKTDAVFTLVAGILGFIPRK